MMVSNPTYDQKDESSNVLVVAVALVVSRFNAEYIDALSKSYRTRPRPRYIPSFAVSSFAFALLNDAVHVDLTI